jgi:hypothetical protein
MEYPEVRRYEGEIVSGVQIYEQVISYVKCDKLHRRTYGLPVGYFVTPL